MNVPHRIQLSRAKGWRKPEGAIVVARPSRWGNQFRVGDEHAFIDGDQVHGIDEPLTRSDAVQLFRIWIDRHPIWADAARRELAGRDLACWCPLDEPCHADVLLKLANEGAA